MYAAVCKHADPSASNQSDLSIGSNQTLIIAPPCHIGGDMQTTTELGAAWWILFELCNRQSGGARQTPVKCQFNMSDWTGKRGEGKITIYEVACSRAADLAPLFSHCARASERDAALVCAWILTHGAFVTPNLTCKLRQPFIYTFQIT
jgi:hypothetical protein